MKRRNFLRDIALGIAATLVPRILQPCMPEVKEEVLSYEKDEYGLYRQYEYGSDSYVLGKYFFDSERKIVFELSHNGLNKISS